MKAGTPGWIGARLKEAREVRGIQQVFLAEMLGVSAQAISNYERDKSRPSPEVLDRLVEILNVPATFFMSTPVEDSDRIVYYRSMSAATKSARVRAEHRLSWLGTTTRYATGFVELPPVNVPDLGLPENPLLLDGEEIEHIASEVRAYWGMRDEPVGNMLSLLEHQGVVVAHDALGAATLDSLSEFNATADRPLVLIGTDKGTAVRWRFDAAHELGHLLLHRNLDKRRLGNTAEHKEIENQAHRFAGAFLLPRVAFSEELFGASLDAFLTLKARWRVSVATMIMRARQTELISEATEKRLWINLSRRGWRRAEPLDESLEVERPRLLRRSFELIVGEGAQTGADIVAATDGLPLGDIEALAGLPEHFLDRAAPVHLKPATDWPNNVTPLRRSDT